MDDGREVSAQRLMAVRIGAACGGSIATSLVSNPFDVVRVRMQQSSALAHTNLQQSANGPLSSPVVSSELGPLGSVPAKSIPRASPSSLGSISGFPSAASMLEGQPGVRASPLGVSVCCKDVFWYPSTLNYCVATPEPLSCIISARQPGSAAAKPLTTWTVAQQIVREEGTATLWRGVSLQLVQSIPSNVIYFIAYEHLRDMSQKWVGAAAPLICGGLARSIASVTVSPLELVKTRLQSVQGVSNPAQVVMRSVKDMVAMDGWRSLWSGLGLTLWRDVPFSSIYWLMVEGIRGLFPHARTHSEKFIESFTAGCTGGVVAATVTTPFDVGKTRRQLSNPECSSAHMAMPRFMAHILNTEGWKALFVGLGPRTLKVAPACGIMITSYEMGKRFLT